MIHRCASRHWVAYSSANKKNADAVPLIAATKQAIKVHLPIYGSKAICSG
jgi:hypothetical protein